MKVVVRFREVQVMDSGFILSFPLSRLSRIQYLGVLRLQALLLSLRFFHWKHELHPRCYVQPKGHSTGPARKS